MQLWLASCLGRECAVSKSGRAQESLCLNATADPATGPGGKGVTHIVVTGFDANMCVAASPRRSSARALWAPVTHLDSSMMDSTSSRRASCWLLATGRCARKMVGHTWGCTHEYATEQTKSPKKCDGFLDGGAGDGVSAMGLNKILFSNVHGVVLERGKPVPDALVTRYFNFGLTDESKADTTRTDGNGVFTFPQISRLSLLASIVPAQPDVPQKISITQGGKVYLAWLFTKKNYVENGELRGKPIDLVCELTNERTYDAETKVHGICQVK
jgi:hypothetical protein